MQCTHPDPTCGIITQQFINTSDWITDVSSCTSLTVGFSQLPSELPALISKCTQGGSALCKHVRHIGNSSNVYNTENTLALLDINR